MVRVPPDWKILAKNFPRVLGRVFAAPAVKSRAADSPTMRPMARIAPVRMPGMAEGSKIVRMVYHFPAPRPTAPKR